MSHGCARTIRFRPRGTHFNQKTIRKKLTGREFKPELVAVAASGAARVRHPNFRKAKETAVRGDFIQKVLVSVLGYEPYHPGETFTIATEESLGKGAVDTALGTFSHGERTILAPIELKGPRTDDPLARGGYIRLKQQYIAPTSLRDPNPMLDAEISRLARYANMASHAQFETQQAMRHRIPDLCPPNREPKLTTHLRNWWTLDFKTFQAQIKKAFKEPIPLKQRNEWEACLAEEGDKVRRLTGEIDRSEREIDALVYRLFDLTPDEIALLESSLAGQY